MLDPVCAPPSTLRSAEHQHTSSQPTACAAAPGVSRLLEAVNRAATAAMSGAGCDELVAVFARASGCAVALFDARSALGACAVPPDGPPFDPREDRTRRLARAARQDGRPLRLPAGSDDNPACLALPVEAGSPSLGHVVVLAPQPGAAPADLELSAGSHIATLLGLALAREQAKHAIARRRRVELAESLLNGDFLDEQDAARKMDALGVPSLTPFVVAVLRSPLASDGSTAAPEPRLRYPSLLARATPGAVATVNGADVVAILPSSATTPRQLARRLSGLLADSPPVPGRERASCGLSEASTSPHEIPRLAREAATALEVGIRIGRAGDVVAYGELGVYRLLLKIGDLRELWRFAADVLGALIEHDERHSVDLVRTLSSYLDNGQSPKRTAVALQVHANTVGNRMHRIRILTGLDLDDSDDVLTAHLAVKILAARGAVSADKA